MIRHIAIFGVLVLSGYLAFPQNYGNFPLNNDFQKITLGGIEDEQYNYHSSIKPFNADNLDSLGVRLKRLDIRTNSKFSNAFFNADTLKPIKGQLGISIAPIVNAVYGFGQSNDSSDQAYNFGIGLNLYGFVGKKFNWGFEYVYSENRYADYVENYIDYKGVIPGMGKAIRKNDAFRNKFYSTYLSYDPVSFLNLQAGVGKHFIGKGYRSLILSDNSFVYPYLKLTLDIWKLKYQVLYSFHENLNYNYLDEVEKRNQKYSTSNFLSMNIGKRWNVGLFQTVVWYDEADTKRGFDVNYLNPVVFLRPVEFSIGSPDNILMGLDASFKIGKKYTIYAQIILDEFLLNEIKADSGWWANKYGYQIGIKGHDIFKVKGLSFLAEHNWVRPFTYSHNNTNQNYGHYNEALAHTLGSNFYEFVGQLNYNYKRILFSFHSVFAVKGNDFVSTSTNYGGNIFRPNNDGRMEYGNETGQGLSTRKQYLQFKAGYLISPDARWIFEIGISQRNNKFVESIYSPEFIEKNTMFHIGIKTLLHNQYLDF